MATLDGHGFWHDEEPEFLLPVHGKYVGRRWRGDKTVSVVRIRVWRTVDEDGHRRPQYYGSDA